MKFPIEFRAVGRENAAPQSNLEIELMAMLGAAGIPFLTGDAARICLRSCEPDFSFTPIGKAVSFLDGQQVHRNRELRDQEIRDMLRDRGYKVWEYEYKSPCPKWRKHEIFENLVDNIKGLRRMQQ